MKTYARAVLFALVVLLAACQPANPIRTETSAGIVATQVAATIASIQTATASIEHAVQKKQITVVPSSTPTPIILTPTLAATTPVSPPRVVVIDTDMAPDDWGAILYLLQRPDIIVKAITVVGTGEAHCAQGVRNALGLIRLAGDDQIPVACGRETPLKGNHAFPDGWRQGADNLFGLALARSQNKASDLNAAELLASTILSSPQKVTLLTLGPLTNIADALQFSPSFVDNIEKIFIMGGAVDVPGNIAVTGVPIDNQVAEWNIYIDPFAANVVFASGMSITLVPLDATNDVPVTNDFYQRLKASHTTPEAAFIVDLYTKNNWLVSGKYYFWDQLTAAILTDEELASYRQQNLCVIEEEGRESGRIVAGDHCPIIRFAVSADRPRFETAFLNALNEGPLR